MAAMMMPSGQQVAQQIQPGMPQQPGQMPPQQGPQGPAPGQGLDPAVMQQAQAMQQQGASPGEIEAFIALQKSGQQSAESNRSRALAKQLRGDAAAQFKGQDTGKFYVGPTWVNMLANVAQNSRAGREEESAKAGDAKTAEDRERATRVLMQALTQQQR